MQEFSTSRWVENQLLPSPQCCWPGIGVAGHVHLCGVSWNALRDIKEPGRKMKKSKNGEIQKGGWWWKEDDC